MITYRCQKCGEELESPDGMQGQQEVCPQCGSANDVPILAAEIPTQDPLAALNEAVGAVGSVPSSIPPLTIPGMPKLRFRRPVFAGLRSGLGMFLVVGFFLPWLDVTCNNTTLMQPSAFNLATGIPDSKTRGTRRMADDMSNSFGNQRGGQKAPPESELSLWDSPKTQDKKGAARGETDVRTGLARICVCIYGFLLFPMLLVLSCLLLWGQFSSKHLVDPPWDSKMQRVISITAPIAAVSVLLFGVLFEPSDMPPVINISLDWGFYLSILTLAGLTTLLAMEKMNPPTRA